jgi:hypothetical protein
MTDKEQACAFADWLWKRVDEKVMMSKTWEELYDLWQSGDWSALP